MQNIVGLTSFIVGAFSLASAATVSYARSVKWAGSSFILDWLSAHDLVKVDHQAIAVVSRPSFLVVTDERALYVLSLIAISLAVMAMTIALIAEFKRESTLYLSGGYLLGAYALLFFGMWLCIFALITGALLLLVVRPRNENEVRNS